ncbi:PssE/Cps14G family polysaccharide biosynthesis glycosyltransferase [uncultured Clostridium sp.]|uniref:PssE/Cps14G family polysaccharide biosynthesis glycosyltransferase n=1 Tax=uncultured Clostridium sp. TaxID=59620 RepID=UPI002605FA0F|nr:PssE/Cps14G family polysaccharide biosynthesis glycosyltransferase [uncultured Clostridium sp.]
MIFVTLGTHELSFKRMLEYLEKLDLTEEVLIQSGNTEFKSDKYKIVQFLSPTEFDQTMEKCDLVITHGGVGSILGALKREKKVITMARLQKYNEHNDDHQLEICEKLANDGYIVSCTTFEEFQNAVLDYKNLELKPYKFDNTKLLRFIEEVIG